MSNSPGHPPAPHLTPAMLLAWLEQCDADTRFLRGETAHCPLAEYFYAHGVSQIHILNDHALYQTCAEDEAQGHWYREPLPPWAQQFVTVIDRYPDRIFSAAEAHAILQVVIQVVCDATREEE